MSPGIEVASCVRSVPHFRGIPGEILSIIVTNAHLMLSRQYYATVESMHEMTSSNTLALLASTAVLFAGCSVVLPPKDSALTLSLPVAPPKLERALNTLDQFPCRARLSRVRALRWKKNDEVFAVLREDATDLYGGGGESAAAPGAEVIVLSQTKKGWTRVAARHRDLDILMWVHSDDLVPSVASLMHPEISEDAGGHRVGVRLALGTALSDRDLQGHFFVLESYASGPVRGQSIYCLPEPVLRDVNDGAPRRTHIVRPDASIPRGSSFYASPGGTTLITTRPNGAKSVLSGNWERLNIKRLGPERDGYILASLDSYCESVIGWLQAALVGKPVEVHIPSNSLTDGIPGAWGHINLCSVGSPDGSDDFSPKCINDGPEEERSDCEVVELREHTPLFDHQNGVQVGRTRQHRRWLVRSRREEWVELETDSGVGPIRVWVSTTEQKSSMSR